MKKATNQEIIDAYKATGSVWQAGKRLGMAGQSVHERLVVLEYPLAGRRWTEDEVAELQSLVAAGMPLGEVARRLGRPFGGTAAKASELGIKVKRNHKVVIPRGAGFDKSTMAKHIKAL